jgi:hypothetical protein
MPSLCTTKVQRDYFAGLIPANGTRCDPDVKTFPKPEDEATAYATLSVEEKRILEAVQKIGNYYVEARLGL